jgi:DNA repair exonuclease SbcCD nuclease subunit
VKILHTADWHFDLPNLEETTHAVQAIPELVGKIDLVANCGDLGVHRGYIHPHVALSIRREVFRLNDLAKFGSIVLSGNHDTSLHAERAGTVNGLFGGSSTKDNVRLAEKPMFTKFLDGDGTVVGFVCIPTPNKYILKAVDTDSPPEELLANLIRAEIHKAKDEVDRVVVLYHGTVLGARFGDEGVMTAGMDVAVPRSVFAGADAVMLGHIHNEQVFEATAELPPMIYCGSIAPLTWGDVKLKPKVYVWEINADGVKWTAHSLPVLSQMLHFDLSMIGEDADHILTSIRSFVAGNENIEPGSRVRIRVAAPRGALRQIDPKFIEKLSVEHELKELKIVHEPVDDGIVRLDLGDEWEIPDAFEKYMEFLQVPEESKEACRRICIETESAIVDKHLDAKYDFKPMMLEVTNWCQFDHFKLNFDDVGPVTAITGANFAGKSNLARAILFALYKKQISGKKNAELVKKPEKNCVVELSFASHGKAYRVRRELKIGGTGNCSGDVQLVEFGSGVVVPINEGNAAKTQDTINSLVGPLSLFLTSAFAGQNEIDRLLDLTPGEMKDVLMGVLQRNFEGRAEIARKSKIGHEKTKDETLGKRDVWSQLSQDTELLKMRLAGAEINLTDAEMVLASINDEKAAEGLVDDAKQSESDRIRLLDDISASKQLSNSLKVRLDQVASKLREAQRAKVDVEVLLQESSEDKQAGMSEVADKMQVIRAEVSELTRDRMKHSESSAKNIDVLAGELREAQDDLFQLTSEMTAIKMEISRCEKAESLLGGVPCGGESWQNGSQDGLEPEVDMGKCRFLIDAKESALLMPLKRGELAGKDVKAGEHRESIQRLSGAVDGEKLITAAVTDKISEKLLALAQDEEVLTKAWALAKEADSKRAERLARISRLDEVASHCDEYTTEGRKIDAELLVSQNDLEETTAKRQALGDTEFELSMAIKNLQQIRTAKEVASNAITVQTLMKATIIADLKKSEEAAGKVIEIDSIVDSLTSKIGSLSFYIEAMKRDGLPFLLLEKFAIPGLQRLINEYLGQTSFRVSVSSERELQTGEQRNAVNITFTDHRGTHDLSAASGFQRTAIGMAMMAALADLNAEATGSRIWFTLQDEGFGTMDSVNLDGAKATIRKIAEHRGWFFFISHIAGMASAADSEIRVVDDGRSSHIEVER